MTATTTGVRTVPPLRLDPAYLDRAAVWRTVLEHAPYPLMSAGKGYGEMMGDHRLQPWFRSTWAVDGRARDAATQALLDDERFLAQARALFGATVARPHSLVVNVMGPMDAGARHVDTPTYRGFAGKTVPIWLSMVMGLSGLFERWAVRVAGVLTWFHDGADGAYEYWPLGLDGPSDAERGPFGNVALVGDNDLMFHRVAAIGDAHAFRARITLQPRSHIRPADDAWEITDGAAVIGTVRPDEVRTSLLWRAVTFRDEAEARVFDQHEDDLDVATMVAMFGRDLERRGIPFVPPAEPFTDPAWSKTLVSTYLAQAFVG